MARSQQLQREYTDPRENPNFFLNQEVWQVFGALRSSAQDPNFWYNAARKPHMKALLRSDDHWKHLGDKIVLVLLSRLRKNTWLEQFQQARLTIGCLSPASGEGVE